TWRSICFSFLSDVESDPGGCDEWDGILHHQVCCRSGVKLDVIRLDLVDVRPGVRVFRNGRGPQGGSVTGSMTYHSFSFLLSLYQIVFSLSRDSLANLPQTQWR